MSRLNIWLAFGLIAAGVTIVHPAQACPLWDASNADRMNGLGDNSPSATQAVRPDNTRSEIPWQMGMSGLGAIASVLAVGAAYARFRQEVAIANSPSFQLELQHPELALVSLPSEARGYSSML